MQDLTMANEFVKWSVVAICEASVDMRMVLEQKEVKLDLSFGVGSLVNDCINWLYLALNQSFSLFVSSFDEHEYLVESLDRVQE